MPARILIITGRVQGVFYRATARAEAERLHLTGWAKNRTDGSVEIFAQGSPEALEEFAAWCREGPPAAEVDDVKTEVVAEQDQKEFTVIHGMR